MRSDLTGALKYDPNQPRVPAGQGDPSGQWTKVGHSLHEKLVAGGGFTYQPILASSPVKGYALSISRENERVFEGDVTEEQIAQYIADRESLFRADPQAHVGGWLDVETGKVYLDVSIIEPDRETAIRRAQEYGQEGIYDLEKGETVIVKRPEERRKSAEEDGAFRLSSGGDPEGDRGSHQSGPPRALEEALKYDPGQKRHPAGTPWAASGPGPGRFAAGGGGGGEGSGLWASEAERWRTNTVPLEDLELTGVFHYLEAPHGMRLRVSPLPDDVFDSLKEGLKKMNIPDATLQEVSGTAFISAPIPFVSLGATAMFDMAVKHLLVTSEIFNHPEEEFHLAIAHELGHAVDFTDVPRQTAQESADDPTPMIDRWKLYARSAAKEFAFKVTPEDDAYIHGEQQKHTTKASGMTQAQFNQFFADAHKRITKGAIAKEAVSAVVAGLKALKKKTYTDKELVGMKLRYPLVAHFMQWDGFKAGNYARTSGEIFAQLHALYYTHRPQMQKALPKAFAYFDALDKEQRGETDVRKDEALGSGSAADTGLPSEIWVRALKHLPITGAVVAEDPQGRGGQQAHPGVCQLAGPTRDALGMNPWQLALKFTESSIARHPKGTPWAATGPGPGRFKSKDGKGGAGGSLEGYSDRAKLVKGVIVTDNVDDAARALFENRKVQLDSPRKVSVLLDKLNAKVKEMIAKGEKAGLYNLCNVTVPGTSLFCAESKGIPRVEMPQLKFPPTPGTPAAKLTPDVRGEVDISAGFRQHLLDLGFKISDGIEKAAYMKASQNELNGAKVAGIAQAIREKKLADERLFISQDNYIVDGHHRWAAMVGVDSDDGHLGDLTLPVARVEVGIIELLALANTYAKDQGAPQMSADDKAKKLEKDCGCAACAEKKARQLRLPFDKPRYSSLL